MNSHPNGGTHVECGYHLHLEPEAYVLGTQLEAGELLLDCEPQADPLSERAAPSAFELDPRERRWIEFFELCGEGRCLD